MNWKTAVCAIVGHKWTGRTTGQRCARCGSFHPHNSRYSTTMQWDGDGWHPGR